MALTERQKFERFVEKHPGAKADAYYWCSGKTWSTRRYRVVLLVKSGNEIVALGLKADTPAELAAEMREAGYQTTPQAVARMCHAAPISPRRPNKRPALDRLAPS